jgi:hypothetical protein
MKRLQVLALAVVACSAFGAVLVASASAETSLTAEWLANGIKIPAALPSKITGEILMEDNKAFGGKGAILCSFILDGLVGPGAADTITEVLTLAGVRVEPKKVGTGLLCTADEGSACEAATEASPIEVWPIATLPWKTTIFLTEGGKFLDIIEASGFEILCLALKVNVNDSCSVSSTTLEVVNSTGAQIPSGAEQSPAGVCTLGGAGADINVAEGTALITLNNGEALTVSE